LLSNEFAFK
jgi:hypothetical protein